MSSFIRRAAVAILILTITGSSFAQDKKTDTKKADQKSDKSATAKPKIATQTVKLKRDDATFDCYIARPDSEDPAPGILLIHEWWGLNDWVKQQADRFAEKGYCAMAVDLYHGEIAKDAEHAHELMRGLADERAIGDLRVAYMFLSNHKYTKGKKSGVIGWCMGGGFALKLAIEEPRLACTVICYGKPVTDVNQLKRIKGPILGIWGATDRGIEVAPFKKALNEAKVTSTHTIYPGAGHAFLNETNKKGYNKEQAEKAWKEIDGFFEKELEKRA